MPRNTHRPHLIDAMRALGLAQRRMADRLGVSARTLQRWGGKLQYASAAKMHALARTSTRATPTSRPRSPYSRGRPPSPSASTLSAPPRTRIEPTVTVLVDSIVCAAAEAASVVPATIRPALHAALIR